LKFNSLFFANYQLRGYAWYVLIIQLPAFWGYFSSLLKYFGRDVVWVFLFSDCVVAMVISDVDLHGLHLSFVVTEFAFAAAMLQIQITVRAPLR